MSQKNSEGRKIISDNRQGRFNYHIIETYEAGVALQGTEVKSIREGKVNLRDGYALIRNNEAWLLNVHISPYQKAGDFFNHEPRRSRRLLLHKQEIRKLIGKVDAMLTVSDELALRLGGGTVLYNSELLETVKKPVLHDRFGLDGIVAGYIGGLRKPILEEILDAASKVNALSILIVGGPPKGHSGYTDMISELEELALEKGANAKFTGPLPYSMMNECYAACDILMVGHYVDERMRDYALPKKLLDSMAYKVPVIVGPYEARQKIVERYECGLVTEDWANALTTLANDKELRKKMGENGYKAFKMNYSWELQEKKMLEVYDELLKEEGQ